MGAPGARRLGAQVPESASLQLDYAAPDGCPARARFEQRLRARLSRHAGRARLQVRIALAADGAVGEISLARPHGASAVRKLTARDCEEAVDALALVAALMLEPPPQARAEGTRAASASAAPRHGSRGASTAHGAGQQDARPERSEASQRAGAAAEAEQRQGAGAEAEPEPGARTAGAEATSALAGDATRATPGPAAAAQAAAPSPRPPLPARRAAPVRRQITLGAAALVATGVAPAARVGGAFALGLLSQRAPRFELAAHLGVRFVQAYDSERDQGHVEMRWWSGSASLCAGTPLGGRAGLDGCLAGELGRLHARGSDTSLPSSSDRLWSALGPALLGRWRVLGPLSLEGGLHALFPLVRHHYVLAEESVHSVPRLTFRGELGVLLQFP
jgi:hypothetical protein